MSSSQQSREMSHKAGEIAGQAQIKKDEYAEKICRSLDKLADDSRSDQNSSIASQATNFLQQTGEQVRHMAQGAAEAVKSTLGMNYSETNNRTTNTTTPSMPPHPPPSS